MKVLVTGAKGFVGKNLCAQLNNIKEGKVKCYGNLTISEVYEYDIDSTPDNKVPEEDDQDDAPVLISISTGEAKIYYALGFAVLITIAGGIILIKKFVL